MSENCGWASCYWFLPVCKLFQNFCSWKFGICALKELWKDCLKRISFCWCNTATVTVQRSTALAGVTQPGISASSRAKLGHCASSQCQSLRLSRSMQAAPTQVCWRRIESLGIWSCDFHPILSCPRGTGPASAPGNIPGDRRRWLRQRRHNSRYFCPAATRSWRRPSLRLCA